MSNIEDTAWLQLLFGEEPLYIFPSEAKEEEEEGLPAQGIAYQGGFSNGITVVYQHPTSEFSQTPEYTLLQKILLAVKCNIAETALVNLQENPEIQELSHIQEELTPKKTLFFLSEDSRQQFGMNIPLYQVESHADNTKQLCADPLDVISGDQDLKKKLWVQLQLMFGA